MKTKLLAFLATLGLAFAQPSWPISNARFSGTNNVLSGATFQTLSGASSIIAAGGSLTNANLTSGRVVFSSTGGLEADSALLTFNSGTGALSATNHIGLFAGNTFTTGTGTLTIAASKTLTASDNITMASDGTGTRTLNIAAGGTLGSNAFTSTAYLPLTGGTLTGNLLFTDNTYDIGASNATRPRSIYVGTLLTLSSTAGTTASGILFGADTNLFRPGVGSLRLDAGSNSSYFAIYGAASESSLLWYNTAQTSGSRAWRWSTSGAQFKMQLLNDAVDTVTGTYITVDRSNTILGSGSTGTTALTLTSSQDIKAAQGIASLGPLIAHLNAGGAVMDYSSSITRFLAYGADNSTNGSWNWQSRRADGSANATVMTLSSAGAGTFSGQLIGGGTTTNNNAAAGVIGEYVSSLVPIGSPQSLTTNTAANVTSITLTAGDWDVVFLASVTETTSTVTARTAGISATSATLPTDGSEGYNGVQSVVTSETNSIPVARTRMNLSGTTTIYAVEKVVFSAGTAGGFGSLNARRPR